jgi:hypothetical protein
MKQKQFDATQERHTQEDIEFMKNETIPKFWGTPDERNACKTCGATIMMKKIYWSLHEMSGHAGSGQTSYEGRPYCPRCKKPEYTGGCLDL